MATKTRGRPRLTAEEKIKTANVTVHRNTQEELNNIRMQLSSQFGFDVTLNQTLQWMLKNAKATLRSQEGE